MLKGINPLLSPDLLRLLRAMGHGDEIAIVDANFPADSVGPPVVRLTGIPATDALDAILSVMPLDDFVPEAAWRMEMVGQPNGEQPIFDAFRELLRKHGGERRRLAQFERFAFYERAKSCVAIISTGELRLYGNIILKKGVIGSAE